MAGQRSWERITLLTVLGYEGAGALVGGSLLVAKPDGEVMDMPVSIMHGAFPDFLIPGIILFGLGLLNAAAFIGVLRRTRTAWMLSSLAIGGLAIWFFVEIVILRELHWLHVMWGFPVILGGVVTMPLLPVRPEIMRNVFLVCGVLSSLLYVAMNVVVAMQWPAYDWASQTVSELSAVGAPTRPLWVVLGLGYTLLVTAFGWGVRAAAGNNGRLRIAGTLIAIYGALGAVWPFAPMHLRQALVAGGATFSDTVHIVLGVTTVLIYILALGFAGAGLGRVFRAYSVASLVILVVAGVLTFKMAPRLSLNLPTPLLGVWERVSIGVFLLWVMVLAIALLVRGQAAGQEDERRATAARQTGASAAPARWWRPAPRRF
jgi:hypothetical protein